MFVSILMGLALPVIPLVGVIDVRPLTNSMLVIHYRDGYVIHHKIGQPRSEETVVAPHPLDVAQLSPSKFELSSADDVAYFKPTFPNTLHRKTKGTDFAWHVDSWVNGVTVNTRPDYAAEHWIYLSFDVPLKDGSHYHLACPKERIDVDLHLAGPGRISDALHVNLVGYRPDSPCKFAYLYAWQGDGGGLDIRSWVGKKFSLIDESSGKEAFAGDAAFRKSAQNPETQNLPDSPNGNFLAADVAECDFSAFKGSGKFRVEVKGLGASESFVISDDVYRSAFKTTMQGLLGNRSGIELKPPSVPYRRPAPHNPNRTPGFAGKLYYTTSRFIDRKDSDYSAEDKPAVEAGILGNLDVSGWYQDAGDWDSYAGHIAVPQQLMLAFQLAPKNFWRGELKLPEPASKLPDILVEASWLPRFCYRLRHELIVKKFGSGGLGLRICGDYFGSDTGPNDVGRGSWQDVDRKWTASGEDPVSTYGYAAVSANMALCLNQLGQSDPEGVDWRKEAIESFAWASSHSRPGDELKPDFREFKIYALAGLALLTGASRYDSELDLMTRDLNGDTKLWWNALAGPALYLTSPVGTKNLIIADRFRRAVLGTAAAEFASSQRRALRWGGDWGMPMLIGQQTTPWVEALAVASVLSRKTDPTLSQAYLGAVETTADYFLGTNPEHQTWVTGLGPSFPTNVFQMDSWYVEGSLIHPGLVPYGPWRKEHEQGVGPWDHDWANKSCYPPIDEWPGAERWFSNRCSPLTSEFTIWQNIAPSAFTYGFLCGSR